MAASPGLTAHLRDGKQELPEVEPLRRLSPSVFAVLGMNPGPFALTGTNTYLVGTGARRILIDAGEGAPEYLPKLEEAMRLLGVKGLQEIVVTHWHFDHLGGVPSVVERFGPVPVRKFMPEADEQLFGGEGSIDPYSVWPRDRFVPLTDGELLRTEGATLRVLYTPGHANDHVALVHQEEKVMFTGDNVLGVGTAVFRDLADYMRSLERMRDTAVRDDLVALYPAHGPAAHPDRLAEYLSHRHQRVEQVHAVLGELGEHRTAADVARKLYPEVPATLLPAAVVNTLQALLKLERDGVIVRRAPGVGGDASPADAEWSVKASKL